jgi:predicted transcriptional regulator of viral defense system
MLVALLRLMAGAFRYIADLSEHERYHFTTDEAVAAFGGSLTKARAAIRRLKERGRVADPHRGFHVIVLPDYRHLGCLPAEQFLPHLMQHLGEPYYVCLLSAAELHGVRRHRHPFQVMLKTNRKPIECGEVRIQFVARKDLELTATDEIAGPRGPLRVASPEATALELVGYAEQCGGLERVVSILPELSARLDSQRLLAAARSCPIAWAQRLGYLLDLTHQRKLGNALASVVRDLAHDFAPLVRARPKAGATRLSRWKLAVNASV